jgi:hypothetical protein
MSKTKSNLYLSFDIETDGDNPMLRNMMSIGFYGVTDSLTGIFSYSANLVELEGHEHDQLCMDTFWSKQPDAWNFIQINKRSYVDIMLELSEHFTALAKFYTLKFIAMPSCFDWMFFKSYYEMVRNIGDNKKTMYDIGFKCICISSYFDAYCDSKHLNAKDKEKLKLECMEYDPKVDHIAIEDAKCQAKLYIKIRNMNLNHDNV